MLTLTWKGNQQLSGELENQFGNYYKNQREPVGLQQDGSYEFMRRS